MIGLITKRDSFSECRLLMLNREHITLVATLSNLHYTASSLMIILTLYWMSFQHTEN